MNNKCDFRLSVLVFLLLFLFSCSDEKKNIDDDNVIPVEVTKVNKEMVPIIIRTTGKIVSSVESKLSFKVPGLIKSLSIKAGQSVRKGDLLASLDLSEMKSNLKNAENGYEKAKRDLDRVSNLYSDSVATLEQLQNSQTFFDIAESNLAIAKFNLKYSEIRAPSDGKILAKFFEKNEIVNAGTPVLLFGNNSSRWIMKAGLADTDIIKVSMKDSAKVIFDTFPGEIFLASVTGIGQAADPYTGTYEIELTLDKTKTNFISGFIGKAEIFPGVKRSMILLPVEALVGGNQNTANVFVPGENKSVSKIKIRIGGFYQGKVMVEAGLENGDIVISEGAAYLKEDSKIRIVDQK